MARDPKVTSTEGQGGEQKLVLHTLIRPFWNGKKMIPRGESYPFPIGKAPRGAKPTPPEAEPELTPED